MQMYEDYKIKQRKDDKTLKSRIGALNNQGKERGFSQKVT
jgi:hypothetical protein